MEAILNALSRTEWLVGAAVAAVILGLVGLIALYKPYVIPIKTHEEQLAAAHARAAKAEADADAETARVRAEFDQRIANIRTDNAQRAEQLERLNQVILSEAKRYADDWRANSHIEAENRKAVEDQMGELIEGIRLVVAIVTALQNSAAGQHMSPPRHVSAELLPGGGDG